MTREDSRRHRKKAQLREHILETALALFERNGFRETTVESIAEAADVAKATFVNHFPTKESVLITYQERIIAETLQHLEGCIERGLSLERLFREHYRHQARLATREGELFRVLVRELLSNPTVMAAEQEKAPQLVALYSQVVSAAEERGELNEGVDVGAAIRVLAGIWSMSAIEWAHVGQDAATLSDMLELKLDIAFRGLLR